MCAQIDDPKPRADRLMPRSRDTQHETGPDAAIATVWPVFYGLANGVAIVSPIVRRTFDVAAR